jgi:hypothetical protein
MLKARMQGERRIEREEESVFIDDLVFCLYPEKLCGLCVLCGEIFFLHPGGRGEFYNFLSNE